MELSTSQPKTSVKNSNILLLTATITPLSGIPILARTDPSARLDDYANALKFYLSLVDQCVDYIIFVENSNSDISRLRAIVDQANLTKSVEFIVFYSFPNSVWERLPRRSASNIHKISL